MEQGRDEEYSSISLPPPVSLSLSLFGDQARKEGGDEEYSPIGPPPPVVLSLSLVMHLPHLDILSVHEDSPHF